MKTYDELFRENAELPDEAFETLKEGFIRAFRDELVGRQLMPTLPLPASTQTYGYDRLSAEGSGAQIIAKGALFPRDEYDLARKTFPVPKIGKSFAIPREDFLAGIIQNVQVDNARRRVAEFEDGLVFNGDSDFGILGLTDTYGNTAAATADWEGAATVLNIYDDIKGLIGLMLADKVQGPYTLVANPTQWVSLGKVDTAVQRSAEELVRRLVARVLVSYTLANGTVLVMKTGEDIARLGAVEDLTVERPLYDADRQEYRGRAYERVFPIVYQYGAVADKSDAVGALTGA